MDSRLDSFDTFTLCSRFKTVQFLDKFDFEHGSCSVRGQNLLYLGVVNPFAVSSAIIYNKATSYGAAAVDSCAPDDMDNFLGVTGEKKLAGGILFEKEIYSFEIWKPNVWNKFCLFVDDSNKHILFTINEAILFEKTYTEKPDIDANIRLMSMGMPMHGAITDLQVWDKLIDEELYFPMTNITHPPGNVVSWGTAEIATNFTTKDSDIVFPDHPAFMAFR